MFSAWSPTRSISLMAWKRAPTSLPSEAGLLRWRVTLPQCFAAFPGDRVTAVQTPLGVRGDFTVESSRSFADGTGAGTVMELCPVR